MPGFDRTGPNGQGPKTGRGMGDCQVQETVNRPMRGGRGAGFGGRRSGGHSFAGGSGRGMGMRMRNRFFAQDSQTENNVAAEAIDELYNQVEALKEKINNLTSHLEKAESEKEQKV